MILLSAQQLTRQFDVEPILNQATFEVRSGDRIGLVGPNGAGKTTLLKIIAGLDQADSGQLSIPQSVTVSLLEQQPDFAPGRSLLDEAKIGLQHILQLQQESIDVAHQLANEHDPQQSSRLQKRFDIVQQELHRLDGFAIDHKIEQVLSGLGFPPDRYAQPVSSLSGGQQNRLLLARLLLRAPDVLLLDEPTNHLDIAATEWLEEYLINCGKAMIVVSHDRYFLDRVCTRMWEQFQGKLTDYPGNFSHYWRLREERADASRKTFERQKEQIAKTEEFIRRNKSGQLSKQAKDREQKLARIELVETIDNITGPQMRFDEPTRTGDWVIDAEELSKGFAGPPLFSELSLRVPRGARLGILGPNGTGKTTLLRTLLKELPPDSGTVRHGTNVKIAYFDQQLSSVDPTLTAIEAIRPSDFARYTDGQLRDLLAKFGVRGELALQSVGAMSGGERSKVALAKIATQQPNVLVLDEPTNHLDLWSRDALEAALKEFAGTLIFVSHDRYFLDRLATTTLVAEQGNWHPYDGNYSDYVEFVRHREAELKALQQAEKAAEKSTARAANNAANTGDGSVTGKRKRQFPYRKVADLEADIAATEARIAQCEADMASEAVHRDPARLQTVVTDYETAQEALRQLFAHWEEALELN